MAISIANAPHTNPTAARATPAPAVAKSATPSQNSTQPQPTPSIPNDTVQISNAAKAAQLEALETPVQTAKEAGSGDPQAQRLLAKEAAAQKISK